MASAWQRIEEVCNVSGADKPKVAFDTCCVQYYIGKPPAQPWTDLLDPIFQAGLGGKLELYVSTVVLSELLAHVHFANRQRAGYDPELDLLAILNRHFEMLDVNGEVARAAGRLRGSYVHGDKMVLRTPDALIGATSIANGHTLFVTNDAQLADALPETNCIYLRDAALEFLEQRFPVQCLDGAGPVKPARRGPELPRGTSLATLELGSVRPDAATTWRRILGEAFTAASALNEPCVFFVLTMRRGRKTETQEVLFWHEGLSGSRPPKRIVSRLRKHLELKYDRERGTYTANPKKHIHAFFFILLARERARQSQPCYASKSEHQRNADSWNGYLAPLWRFRDALRLPQTKSLLCENGVARTIDPEATARFLGQAKNVLGWEDGR